MGETGRLEPWWGTFVVPEGDVRYWRIGPLELWFARQAREWRFRHANVASADPVLDPHLDVDVAASQADLEADPATLERVGLGGEPRSPLCIAPALADRFVITRPREPFTILPGEEVELFVSSPLWVQISVGSPAALVREVPTHRPSDTWFGATTVAGDLCYASRTHCRRALDEIPLRPHRATTAVLVRNAVPAPLALTRLAVPVPRLGLFAAPNGSLFTESLILTRESADDDLAHLAIGESPPAAARATTRVAGAREVGTASRLIRAFNALF